MKVNVHVIVCFAVLWLNMRWAFNNLCTVDPSSRNNEDRVPCPRLGATVILCSFQNTSMITCTRHMLMYYVQFCSIKTVMFTLAKLRNKSFVWCTRFACNLFMHLISMVVYL